MEKSVEEYTEQIEILKRHIFYPEEEADLYKEDIKYYTLKLKEAKSREGKK